MGRLKPILIALLGAGLLATGPEIASQSQVLDAGRGYEDGCDRPPPPPNSAVTVSRNGPVVQARYFGATDVYGHGVLGDAIEAEGLLVRFDNGARVICDTVMAGPKRVFEDTSPRLVDFDGDGMNEVVAVAAHESFGARLELYGYPGPGQDFQLLAHTPYIGRPFRWLAPVGFGDFDNDTSVDIAYVETPHLGKTLKIVNRRGRSLVEIASASGFSNHRIGDPDIPGGVRDCGDGLEIIVADGQWQRVMAVTYDDGKLTSRSLGPYKTSDSLRNALRC
ncbi:MAG: VCBS repeat-containing protein [Pseudomonadota bacterium]